MKLFSVKIIAFIATIGIWSNFNADSDFRLVHTCMLKDGKTMDDVRVANSKWVVFVNEHVEGGGITSHITTSIVGDTTPRKFGYVDSYPSLESWTAQVAALESIAEGITIDRELREVADCAQNELYKAEES